MLLTDLPIPQLDTEQLQVFTPGNIHAVKAGSFDPQAAIKNMQRHEGQTILGIDIGGDKIDAIPFIVYNKNLIPDETNIQSIQSSNGESYVSFLEKIAKEVTEKNIPVGISFGGGQTNVDGTIAFAPNVQLFAEEFTKKYISFYSLFPNLIALPPDDAVSGLMASAVEAKKQFPEISNIIFVINGSGLAVGALKQNEIILTESGHVPIVKKLNSGQDRSCEVFGDHICIERVAASKAGIEDIWLKKTGERRDGKDIAKKYLEGNQLATTLYDSSAVITAHALVGFAHVYTLLEKDHDAVVIFHGGTCNVSGYKERVLQILKNNNIPDFPSLFTTDFSKNACAQGAAIAALMEVKS